MDTDHYGGCWEESEPCQGEVCRYDPEGEHDTDTDNGDNYNARTVLGASLDTGECQPGQFICLGQTPSLGSLGSSCDFCLGHFLGCRYGMNSLQRPCDSEIPAWSIQGNFL